ncbi:alcohol dehydrogenase catalytic domain-containing protein, partial [Streptomyces sp. P17]|uniref:alcohol dehydrogenase catalytic domain-containing protein n=1 Tax=Streptomyces sp. P17 TaxID=3074716 RepID=UPI0028F42105
RHRDPSATAACGHDRVHSRPARCADRCVSLPLTMGHETVGDVVALGPDAKGVKAGDVRLVYPWLGCGKCELCLADEENMCLK